jgi:RNA polymerase sigma-B factor
VGRVVGLEVEKEGEQQAEAAHDHQDHAHRVEIDSANVNVGGELQDCPNRDQKQARAHGHRSVVVGHNLGGSTAFEPRTRDEPMTGLRTGPPGLTETAMCWPEDKLFERYAATRDAACREALVKRFLPLARGMAGRYACGGEPFDDLFQVASVGLVKAIDRYDTRRGTTFITYAVPTIDGEIKRHYRDATWSVRIPRSVHDLAMRLRRLRERLAWELGRAPTVAELADAAGVDEEAVLDALGALTANECVSLQTPSDDGERSLGDELGGDDDEYARVEQRALINDLLQHLTVPERRAICLRFRDDLTQCEIGERLGMSQVAVSRLLRSVLPRLGELAERGTAELSRSA